LKLINPSYLARITDCEKALLHEDEDEKLPKCFYEMAEMEI